MTYEVRRAAPEERALVEDFARRDPTSRAFPGLWIASHDCNRPNYWESYPPIIAEDSGGIVGLHAFLAGPRTGTLNTYFIVVAPEARGRGVARALLETALVEEGFGRPWWRWKSAAGGDAEAFWRHLGARPFGRSKTGKELYWCAALPGLPSLAEVWWAPPPPERMLRQLARQGGVLTGEVDTS